MNRITLISILFLSIITFAQPNWNPTIYTNSTTAYATVSIDGTAASIGDIVGAFVNNECRAKGGVVVNQGLAYVTLLIQGEQVEEVNFKLYDASSDGIYDVPYKTQSNPGGTIGIPPNYLPLDITTQANSLTVTPFNRDVGSDSGSATFSITSNIGWNVSEEESWLSVTPTSGSNDATLAVSYDSNTTTSERVGAITVCGSGITQEVTVTQSGRSDIKYQVTTCSTPSDGGTTTGSGQYDENSTVSVSAIPNSEWNFLNWTENGSQVSTDSIFTFTLSNDRNLVANFIPLGCTPNWTPVIYTNSTTAYGLVAIDGSPASVGDIVGAFVGTECRAVGDVVLNQGSAYVTLLIQGEVSETVNFKIFDKSDCRTLDIEFNTVSNPGSTIGIPPNYLHLNANTLKDSLVITPTDVVVGFGSGTKTVYIKSNIDWTTSETVSWLNVSPDSGSSNGNFILSYTENTTINPRLGKIIVSGGGIVKEVTVTQGIKALPPQPQLISPTNNAINQPIGLKFVWKKSQTNDQTILINNYWFELSSDTSGTTDFSIDNLSDTTYYVSNLEYKTNYWWRVSSNNDLGWGDFSEWNKFTTNNPPPQTVSLKSPINNGGGYKKPLKFVWRKAEYTDDYVFNLSTTENFTTKIVETIGIIDTFLIIDDLDDSTKYYWRVYGRNNVGTSDWSEEWNFTTFFAAPSSPDLVSPENNIGILDTVENVKFVWSSVESAEEYIIEIANIYTFDSIDIVVDNIIDTSINLSTHLLQSPTYWRVCAGNQSGVGAWSEVFTIDIISDIDEFGNTIPSELTLHQNYPNPFNPSTLIRFEIHEQSNVKIEIFNMLGQSVGVLVDGEKSAGNYETKWEAANLPSGIYFITLRAESINSENNFTQVKKALLLK